MELLMSSVRAGNLTDLATSVFSIWYLRHFQKAILQPQETNSSPLELDSFQDLTQNRKEEPFSLKDEDTRFYKSQVTCPEPHKC